MQGYLKTLVLRQRILLPYVPLCVQLKRERARSQIPVVSDPRGVYAPLRSALDEHPPDVQRRQIALQAWLLGSSLRSGQS